MSGPIPAAVREKLQPPPADWRPQVHEDDNRIWWRGRVATSVGSSVSHVAVEYGFSKRTGHDAAEIRRTAWEITELARLGRLDLINWARTDRHASHPISRPTITEANMGQNLGAASSGEDDTDHTI